MQQSIIVPHDSTCGQCMGAGCKQVRFSDWIISRKDTVVICGNLYQYKLWCEINGIHPTIGPAIGIWDEYDFDKTRGMTDYVVVFFGHAWPRDNSNRRIVLQRAGAVFHMRDDMAIHSMQCINKTCQGECSEQERKIYQRIRSARQARPAHERATEIRTDY